MLPNAFRTKTSPTLQKRLRSGGVAAGVVVITDVNTPRTPTTQKTTRDTLSSSLISLANHEVFGIMCVYVVDDSQRRDHLWLFPWCCYSEKAK